MRYVLLLLPFLIPATVDLTAAASSGSLAAGTYQRKGVYSQRAKIAFTAAPDQFAGSFYTSTSGCVGEVGMTGRSVNSTEILFTKKDEVGGTCRIRVKFDPNFRSAKMSEDGCMFWHGTSCDFEGTLTRTKR
ncbi:hypothetical protein MTDSW087_00933 [Methylobacterium dankookense]|uniref:Uncharacterized protein n=1 Tax=Methylobacterium dankookense TaxID=560405 RepID=A0A564FU12_9HYPH|nr:hypothetical protein IFDJLNFL_3349 [Methylobacterium dankookense]VUF11256.1 hypothetical protein MTDSW087_00933 [Methylobacterium dankookense]